MPISSDHVGRVYPPTAPREVTADGVAEFAAVLGLPTDQVPPTYPIIVANAAWQALFDDPELEIELKRIVHGEQKFTQVRPIRIGDRLVGTTTIDRVINRGATEMIHATVALTTEAGDEVGSTTATLIHTREVTE